MVISFNKIEEFASFLRKSSMNEISTNFKTINLKNELTEYITRMLEK